MDSLVLKWAAAPSVAAPIGSVSIIALGSVAPAHVVPLIAPARAPSFNRLNFVFLVFIIWLIA